MHYLRSPLRRLAHSAGSLAMLNLASMALALFIGVLLARRLGPAEYGIYGLAMTIATLAGLITELGLPVLTMREVAAAQATGRAAADWVFHGQLHHRSIWRIDAWCHYALGDHSGSCRSAGQVARACASVVGSYDGRPTAGVGAATGAICAGIARGMVAAPGSLTVTSHGSAGWGFLRRDGRSPAGLAVAATDGDR